MMLFAYMASGKRCTIKYILKGKRDHFQPSIPGLGRFCLFNRYAQLLEQQQGWLVNGIQKLYRCMQTGEGWPADPLKHGANRHPLTHDILTALGVLDPDRRLRREEYGAVQQGFGKHVDECTQPSKFSHNPHSCTPIQLLPMPHDLTVSSPEHQVEGPITDPDLTISGTQKFDTTGIDDPLQLFPNSSSYTFGETSSTTHDDSLVNIFNNDLQMRSSISYFSESNCTSTDSGNDTDCLDPPRDTSIVETWPMWTEPFWGPFHSQDFCSESFVQ
jgi:hypothetical protein